MPNDSMRLHIRKKSGRGSQIALPGVQRFNMDVPTEGLQRHFSLGLFIRIRKAEEVDDVPSRKKLNLMKAPCLLALIRRIGNPVR